MVVQNSQRMTTPFAAGNVPFKIHLPQAVGMRVFEASHCGMAGGFFRQNKAVACQNGVYRTDGRQREADILETALELTGTPGGMLKAE